MDPGAIRHAPTPAPDRPILGYESLRNSQNAWLERQLSSAARSRAEFGQPMHVAGAGEIIDRPRAWAQLDRWLEEWSNHKKRFVLLGEEGDGKTWAVASWLFRLLGREGAPLIVFLPSSGLSRDILESCGSGRARRMG